MIVAGLFQWLTGNPTGNWPTFDGHIPTLDPCMFSLDTLRFGDPLESARVLGRPEEFNRSGDRVTLRYLRGGFTLQFAHDKLEVVDIVFRNSRNVGEEGNDLVRVPVGGGDVLSRQSDRAQIIRIFGEPDESEEIPHENYISFDYERDPYDWTVDFDASGRLTSLRISGNLERL